MLADLCSQLARLRCPWEPAHPMAPSHTVSQPPGGLQAGTEPCQGSQAGFSAYTPC